MKRLLLSTMVIFSSLCIFAQEGINISFLRTGLDADTLTEIVGKKIKTSGAIFQRNDDLVEIVEVERDDNSEYLDIYFRKKFVPNYRIFKAKKFIVSDVEFHGVEMVFHNNKLISLRSNYESKLKDILTFKYKEPVTNIKKDSVHCTFKMTGNDVTYETFSVQYDWLVGKDKAGLHIGSYYNDKCEKNIVSLFYLKDIKEDELYSEEVTKREQVLSDEKDAAKKKDMGKY